MSADPERLFLSAGLMITDRWNRLGIDIIEAIECLKSWMGLKEWLEDHEYFDKVAFGEIEEKKEEEPPQVIITVED